MKRHDTISALFGFAFGSFIILYSIYKLDIGMLKDPGPGFFLLISGIGLCLIAIIIFIKAKLSKINGEINIFSDTIWYKPVIVLAVILFYIYLFKKLGFILDTILLMIFLFKCVEPQSWRVAILYSFLSVFIIWFIFAYWFEVQLPVGILRILGL
jgi:putative tricarboxylic transport membrane protein